MNPYAKLVMVLAIIAALAGIGYSYRATWSAGHDAGYNKRVAEEAQTYKDAEDRGRQAQVTADGERIGALQQLLGDANAAVATHQAELDALAHDKADLTRRLHHASAKSADAKAWLDTVIPVDVLCRVQFAATGSGTTPACPGH